MHVCKVLSGAILPLEHECRALVLAQHDTRRTAEPVQTLSCVDVLSINTGC